VGRKMILLGIITTLFLIYIIVICFFYFSQKRMLFYPVREITVTPKYIGLDFEDIVLTTKDNVNIAGWYVPASGERGTQLFCHGNAGNISHRLDSIRIFHDLNLSVLIFDYRGYGKSEGYPTEEGTYLDAEASLDYLINVKKVHPDKVILFGRSLGSAGAAEIALRHRAGALIIESGFTSVSDLGHKYFPFLPVRLLSRYSYATASKVSKINIPKLFIHSPQDEIIPFIHGKHLYENAHPPKEFLEITGGHNEGFLISGYVYTKGFDRFILRYL
jgi:fermentation-respiration switch protein FrsA (DUF1100 family)